MSRQKTIRTRIELPEKVRPLLDPARYKALYGGRGSAKSQSVARLLLQLALQEKQRILCAREFQKSIADSVMALLVEQIKELGYSELFTATRNSIKCVNGSEFLFAGTRTNINTIRSMHRIKRVWLEEAHSISQESLDVLLPTVREDGSEIWATFNPERESDPIWQMMIAKPMPDTIAIEMNHCDNPWFPEVLKKHMEYLYSVDPEAAEWIYGGRLRKISKAEVLGGKWVVDRFEPEDDWDGPYQGADWGFASHPTALVRCWITGSEATMDKTLWIEREAYGVGVDIDETPGLFDTVPDARAYKTRADCARPETISHMQRHGYPLCEAAPKWAGSVEDGIAHLRSYKRIVVHERCVHTRDDFSLYRFKVDARTGDVLPIVVKLHDDIPDAIRYALSPIIRQPKKPTVDVIVPDRYRR